MIIFKKSWLRVSCFQGSFLCRFVVDWWCELVKSKSNFCTWPFLNFHRVCRVFRESSPTLKNCRCNMSACLSFFSFFFPLSLLCNSTFCGFLCLVFSSCWCLERVCQSELMEVIRSGGFSQNSLNPSLLTHLTACIFLFTHHFFRVKATLLCFYFHRTPLKMVDGGDQGCEFWHMHTVKTHKSIYAHKIHSLCIFYGFFFDFFFFMLDVSKCLKNSK